MKYLVLKKRDFTRTTLPLMIGDYIKDYLKDTDTLFIDIHNTIEFMDDMFDADIVDFIKKYHKKFNIILLSYDGNDERIIGNNKKLEDHDPVFTKIPKIFIKRRKKHYVIGVISRLLDNKFKKTIKKRKVLFIDDNYNNITDAQKLTNITNFEIIHYTKNSNKHFNQSDVKIKDVFDKLLN